MAWKWLDRMVTWVEGGVELVAEHPRPWLAFAAGAMLFAAIPLPGWLMDALAPLGLLMGLRIAGRCEGEAYSHQQTRHALHVAVLWGMVFAVFGMIFKFGQDTVVMGAILSGIQMPWNAGLGLGRGFWGWWFAFGARFSDLALMPYFWFSPAFFGIALALHKGHGWLESEVETSLTLIFRPELRDPLIALWAVILISNVLIPAFSQLWLGLLVWVLGPPVVYVAYQDIFAGKQRPRRKRKERAAPRLVLQGHPQPVRIKI
ncbi:hypothetical protein GL267_013030 [Acidithiobacillus ferrianus]|uniref:Uncharacterized protein n=2 Tax=Acidithiobacillus ferrianus TaxID=2678518 RepID=A0ACD5H551_9PROT|nr:hypothetical protein [Acidithiobacillus ferrianus]